MTRTTCKAEISKDSWLSHIMQCINDGAKARLLRIWKTNTEPQSPKLSSRLPNPKSCEYCATCKCNRSYTLRSKLSPHTACGLCTANFSDMRNTELSIGGIAFDTWLPIGSAGGAQKEAQLNAAEMAFLTRRNDARGCPLSK